MPTTQKRQKRTSNIPILMITALGGLKDKVAGFNSGADDYITKPFDLEELCTYKGTFKKNK